MLLPFCKKRLLRQLIPNYISCLKRFNMQVSSKLSEEKRKKYDQGVSHKSVNLKHRIWREQFTEIRDELFPENWSVDVDNWTRKRYCPICRSSLPGTYNVFQSHSKDFHDDWAELITPWIKWKGLRTKKVAIKVKDKNKNFDSLRI